MRKASLIFCCAIFVTSASASEPGQPLDCSDWVILAPGFSCSVVFGFDCRETSFADFCADAVHPSNVDNLGRLLGFRRTSLGFPEELCPNYPAQNDELYRVELIRVSGGTTEVLAYIDPRCGPDLLSPTIDLLEAQIGTAGLAMTVDHTNGTAMIPLLSFCMTNDSPEYCSYQDGTWLASFSGFAPLFEVLQSYAPSADVLSFTVPARPEGMQGVDRFDSYYGSLDRPKNLRHAKGLRCGYPVGIPGTGDYLEIPDQLAEPAVGEGRYYVTAVTYQGETRYGRKASGGVLSGRDPAELPPCVEPPPVEDGVGDGGER